MDGTFCDAVGQATDGYFCAVRRVIGVGGPDVPAIGREERDRRDMSDILSILLDRHLI